MSPRRWASPKRLAAGALFLPLAVAIAFEGAAVNTDIASSFDAHEIDHVGSETCGECHRKQHRSFAKTFHGRMTREASEETVLGDFDDAELLYGGVTATMHRGPEGQFRITFAGPGGSGQRTVEVVRTVGSHRYQQYLAEEDGVFARLPVAWYPAEDRWFHMNGAFLTPDPPPPSPGGTISEEDYNRHVVRWNDNCIFCHNVGANPGRVGERFESEVAELGVACEACHGPGGRHMSARRDPVRSLALHFADDDGTIVNPEDLSPSRSADICGRCHGQRIADDVQGFMEEGDPFVPGEDLALYTAPLFRDTTISGDEGVFAMRFWGDGTPRLTAYAYQGLLASPCAQRGELTCITCHGMHEGRPAGQLRPEARGDGACIDCHEDLGLDSAVEAHTHHPVSSSGSRCVACHMPPIVYGLIGAHISHRIENPDPAAAEAVERPDACTLCHVERTRGWAIDETARLWGDGDVADAAAERMDTTDMTGDDEAAPLSEVVRALFGGDPIERSVAAEALGAPRRAATEATRAARLGALFDVMANDPYPAVRRIAWRAARTVCNTAATSEVHRLPRLPDAAWMRYRPASAREQRDAAIESLLAALPPDTTTPPDPEVIAPLRAAASETAIHIGE